MDKARALEYFAQAERHVLESQQRIAKQQALIHQLEQDGHDSTMARALLEEFQYSLELHLMGRATIKAELAKAFRSGSTPIDWVYIDGLIQISRRQTEKARRPPI